MALKDALLPEYDHEMGTTRRVLERVPDADLTWKPHDKSYSMGQLAMHLANLPTWVTLTLDNALLDLATLGDDARPRVVAEGGEIEKRIVEGERDPGGQIREMHRELTHGVGLVVRLPRQVRVGYPLEYPARGPHLMVVLWQERVLESHTAAVYLLAYGERTGEAGYCAGAQTAKILRCQELMDA